MTSEDLIDLWAEESTHARGDGLRVADVARVRTMETV